MERFEKLRFSLPQYGRPLLADIVDLHLLNKQTNKQTNKKQTNKQPNKITSKENNKRTNEQTNEMIFVKTRTYFVLNYTTYVCHNNY